MGPLETFGNRVIVNLDELAGGLGFGRECRSGRHISYFGRQRIDRPQEESNMFK